MMSKRSLGDERLTGGRLGRLGEGRHLRLPNVRPAAGKIKETAH